MMTCVQHVLLRDRRSGRRRAAVRLKMKKKIRVGPGTGEKSNAGELDYGTVSSGAGPPSSRNVWFRVSFIKTRPDVVTIHTTRKPEIPTLVVTAFILYNNTSAARTTPYYIIIMWNIIMVCDVESSPKGAFPTWPPPPSPVVCGAEQCPPTRNIIIILRSLGQYASERSK